MGRETPRSGARPGGAARPRRRRPVPDGGRYVDPPRRRGRGTPGRPRARQPAWAYTWRHQIGPLVAAGRRAAAPDLPGCGYSALEVRDPSVAGLSDSLGELLDALGVERASFVASSGGALPVLDLAIRHPERVRSLVLSCPCAVPHRLPRLWRQVTRPVVGEAVGLLLSRRLVRSTLHDVVHDRALVTDQVVEEYYRPLSRRGA